MRLATFISWLMTVGIGAFMLRTWLARGGLSRERAREGGLPPQMIFSHAGLAVAGLLTWAAYLAGGAKPLAWIAIGMLTVTAGLGLSTVTLWTPYPARRPGERRPQAPRDGPQGYVVTDEMISQLLADPPRPARNRQVRPNPAVLVPVAHGFAAMSTFVLAAISASM